MQTIDFVRTGTWIISQFDEETRQMLRGAYPVELEMRRHPEVELHAALELAVVAERLAENGLAHQILTSFGLQMLLDRSFARRLATLFSAVMAERMVRPDRDERMESPPRMELNDMLRAVAARWQVLEKCIEPLQSLLVPSDVTAETDFDAILTLELRYDGEFYPKAETVADVLARANLLYAIACRVTGSSDFPPLLVIFADSGSAVRFDLRGLGEAIKQVKQLLVDLWNRLRHRRADDYRANADALLVGLNVVAAITQLETANAISSEDAARYKHDILEAGVGLFEAGALPREIPRVETVSNQRILVEVQRKLLPAGKVVDTSTETIVPKAASSRKNTKRGSANKRRKKRAG